MGPYCRPAGNLTDISTDCCTYRAQCKLSVMVAAFSSGLWNIHTPIDHILGGRIVQTHVKIDALCKQRWLPEQHPGKKSGHMLHQLCHLLAAGLRSRVPLTRLPLTPQHRLAWLLWCRERVGWRVEWHSVVFSDESRFSLYARDGCTHVGIGLMNVIFQSAFAHDTGPTSGFMVWGMISYNSWPYLVFMQSKVNSALYIAQVVNPMLLPFLQQEGDVLFSRTTQIHIWLLRCKVLFVL